MKRELQPIAPTLAVDPGAGFSVQAATGIVAVVGTEVVYSTNVHRRQGEGLRSLVKRVVARVEDLRQLDCPAPGWTIAVEDVVSPRGHIRGRKSTVTPDVILGIAAIAYGVWGRCQGYFVLPGKAGLAHVYTCDTSHAGRLPCKGGHGPDQGCPREPVADYYPPELIGRRPHGWTGEAGTREHEQEAWDVAFAAWERHAREELIA